MIVCLLALGYLLWILYSATTAAPNPSFDAEAEAFDRQTQEHNRLLADQEKAMQRAEALLSKQEAEAARMDHILDKLEEQSQRKDAILEAEEKQLGIKR